MTSRMYALPVIFPTGTKAAPKDVMYSLASYHDKINGDVGEAEDIAEFDPVKQLEQDQLLLIKKLEQFNKRLVDHLASLPKGTGKESSKPVQGGQDKMTAKASTEREGQDKKTDKNSAKEKDAKKAAAPKPQGTPQQKEETAKKDGSSKPAGSSSFQWTISEEKAAAEENNGIVASATPSIASFSVEKIGKATLSARDEDIVWIEALAKLGGKRGFAFTGAVSNGAKDVNGTIHVENKESTSLTVAFGSISCRVSAMKLLGAHLGLFSFESARAIQSTHVHRWLERLDLTLQAIDRTHAVTELVRDMSKFLATFDALSTQPSFCLADVLIRPLLISSSSFPNNVELWKKRIDALL